MIYFISFLGVFIGFLIGKFTKEELKSGRIYFNLLEVVILIILSVILLYNDFNLILLLLGLIFGLLLKFEYFYFGVALAYLKDFNLLFLS